MPSQRVLIYAVGAIIVVALLLYFGRT